MAERHGRVSALTGELGGRLSGLSIPRQVWVLAIWPFLEQLLGYCVGMTDLMLAGRMGDDLQTAAYLEALAVGAYLGWLMFILQGAASIGATALISRLTGQRDAELANRATAQAAMLSGVIGTGTGMVIFFGAEFIATTLFALDGLAEQSAVKYLRVLAFCGPLSAIVFALNAAQRGAGETMTPFRTMVVVNLVNIGASWWFVFGDGPFSGMGVEGLAYGTLVGWIVGVIVAFGALRRRSSEPVVGLLRLRFREMWPDWTLSWRILRVGIPSAIEVGWMFGIHVAIARRISDIDLEGALGAHIIAIRIESLSFLPGFAIGVAASTLAGQYLGAERPDRAREAIIFCWKAAVVFMSAIGLTLIFFAEGWVALIAPSSEQIVILAAPIVQLAGLQQPFLATAILLKTSMRAAGATRQIMAIMIASQTFWRVIVLWCAVVFFDLGLVGIWIIMGVEMVCQSGCLIAYFRSGSWARQKV